MFTVFVDQKKVVLCLPSFTSFTSPKELRPLPASPEGRDGSAAAAHGARTPGAALPLFDGGGIPKGGSRSSSNWSNGSTPPRGGIKVGVKDGK